MHPPKINGQLTLLNSNDFCYDNEIKFKNQSKTYRALRHDYVRQQKAENHVIVHHPEEKIKQIKKVLPQFHFTEAAKPSVLELFAGRGNLTKVYQGFGEVIAYDKKYLQTGDSFLEFHRLIADKKSFDIIDLDPYGFPNRFFPDIFLLIHHGLMFITMPKPSVNILNGITQTHLICYYGLPNPSLEQIIEKIAEFALCHWRKLEVIDVVDCKSVWRFAFRVQRVKATEYTGVKNK